MKFSFVIQPEKQDKIILDAMRTLHRQWIATHEDLFFLPGNEYERFRFMPLELIGWDIAKAYLPQLELESINASLNRADTGHFRPFRREYRITVEEEQVRLAYERAQRTFRKEACITSPESFYRFFTQIKRSGFDDITGPAIAAALSNDDDLAFQVAAQIIRQNPPGMFYARRREDK